MRDELNVGYEARVGCHHAGYICPYLYQFGVDGCGKDRSGIIGAASSQGGGNSIAVGCDKARQDKEGSFRVIEELADLSGCGGAVDSGITGLRVRNDRLPGILPTILYAQGFEAGGEDQGG